MNGLLSGVVAYPTFAVGAGPTVYPLPIGTTTPNLPILTGLSTTTTPTLAVMSAITAV
jgi:hypothetical protein